MGNGLMTSGNLLRDERRGSRASNRGSAVSFISHCIVGPGIAPAPGNAIGGSGGGGGRMGRMRGSASRGSTRAASVIVFNAIRYRGSLELKVDISWAGSMGGSVGAVVIGGVVAVVVGVVVVVVVKDAIFFFKRGSLGLACETQNRIIN